MTTVVALVFITKNNELLLVKQDYGQEYWSLPGGIVEANETIEQAGIREVVEETGLEVQLLRTIGIYRKREEDSLAITFEAKVVGGDLAPAFEISECRYFLLDELPAHTRSHFGERVQDFKRSKESIIFRQE